MKCINCGNENSSDTKYCTNCGKTLEENQVNKNTAIIAIIVTGIVVLTVIALVLFNTDFSSNTNKVEDGKEITIKTNEELTKKEIIEIEEFINDYEMCGFTAYSNLYSKPSEMNLSESFYNYKSDGEITSKEKNTVLNGQQQIVSLWKITRYDLIDKYEELTGETLTIVDAIKRMKYHQYNDEYDAFYHSHSDTICNTKKIVSGYKNGNIYTVHIKPITSKSDEFNTVVTLKKEYGDYLYISNLKE